MLSLILSNSSMQHIPLSLSTRAPLYVVCVCVCVLVIQYWINIYTACTCNPLTHVCSTSCLVSGSLVTYAVKPTALDPLPDVYWPLGIRLWTY